MSFRAAKIALTLLSVSVCTTTQASWQDTFLDPTDGMLDASKFLSENAYGFLPVPIIITDPAVDGGLGAAGLFFHESEELRDARLTALQSDDPAAAAYLLPPNVSVAAGAVTGNGSWFVGGGHLAFWKQGSIRYGGGAGYGDVKLDFYGNGEIQLPKPISLNTKAWGVFQSIKFKIGDSRWFAGMAQRYISANLSPSDLSIIDDSNLPDDIKDKIRDLLSVDTVNSGLGLVVEYDSRDNVFTPHKGLNYRLDFIRFDEAIGGDIEYNLTRLVGTNYFPINDKFRFNVKLHSEHATGIDELLPPYATPQVELRGVPAGRYQGNQAQDIEAQLDYIIDDRWELLGFVGVGRIATEFSDLKDADNLYSRGVGFRYHIAKRYGFYMGVDVAKGPEENVFYIQAGSAW